MSRILLLEALFMRLNRKMSKEKREARNIESGKVIISIWKDIFVIFKILRMDRNAYLFKLYYILIL